MKIVRQPSEDSGTLGAWYDDQGNKLCYTIELPWHNNHPQLSCIPTGTYEFAAYVSPKHGTVWMAHNVPDRSFIEIHPANLASELLGCIGVGDTIGTIDGQPAVLNSRNTFKMLESRLPDDFMLTIE